LPLDIAGRNVLLGIARYYFALYLYYGGGGVAALRFIYEVRYRIGLYDHAMRCAISKRVTNYLKLIASGDVDGTMLEALEDYVKRQKKRLGIAETKEAAH
jgi:hypothetical protein